MNYNNTQIGIQNEDRFRKTKWTMILAAQNDPANNHENTGKILECYWRPVYAYLRQKGYNNDMAKDYTQAFFTQILERGESSLIHHANPNRGKFRTLLLTALENFVKDEYRKANAAKRQPKGKLVSLEGDDSKKMDFPAKHRNPQEEYHRSWVATLLNDILSEVEDSCIKEGKQKYWSIFQERFLAPIQKGSEAASLKDLCIQYDIAEEKQASNMAITVKRRFASAMRRRVRQWVDTDEEIDEEIADLMRILSHSSAAGNGW